MSGLTALGHGIYGEFAYDEEQGWYCLLCDRQGKDVGETGCDPDRRKIAMAAKAMALSISRARRR